MIPLMMTKTAVSDGWPPISWLMPMAIGVVSDFGAIDRRRSSGAPSAQAMPTALAEATDAPTTTPAATPAAAPRMRAALA